MPEVTGAFTQIHTIEDRTLEQMKTCIRTSCLEISKSSMHHFGKSNIVDTPGIRQPVRSGDSSITFIFQTIATNGDMRYFAIHITGGKISLERISDVAIQCMINSPYTGTGMQTFMPHEILKLSPMSTFGYPKASIQSFQYSVSFFTIGCRVFSNLLGNHSCEAIGTIVIGRRMSDRTTIIIKSITCPDAGIGIIKSVIIGIIVSFFPGKVTGQDRPHTAGVFQITGPVEMPQEFINITKIHVIMMHLIVPTGVTADITVTILGCSPLLFGTCQSKS